ncbi:MAG: flagellar hook-basal body complex protein FliE [Treponema sp.]|nr:flagellar hook-basal body complex protein FliE [Treponema sp.]
MSALTIIGTPEMIRTNPAHAGTAKLTENFLSGASSVSKGQSGEPGKFETYLVKALDEVNGNQLEVNRVTEQLITDPDSVDVHDVTTAMAKAQLSLNLAQNVLDRLVTGWNEISTNR